MPRLCNGYFSEATKEILKKDNGGIAFLSQKCEKCGKSVAAKNKAGEWIPETHYQPLARTSGKSSGRKR